MPQSPVFSSNVSPPHGSLFSNMRRAPGSGVSTSFNPGSKSDSAGSSSGSFSDASRTAHSQGKTPMRLASRSLTGHASVPMSSSLPATDPFALQDWCDPLPLQRKDSSLQQQPSARIVEDLSEFAFDMDGTAQFEVRDDDADPGSPGAVEDPLLLSTFDDS
jgi:hypothetical protein